MNKKGFTLLEVLLVIVILGIILVISVPKVINVIEENKEKVYRNSIKSIEESAREYVTMHPALISDEDFTIELSTLCDAKYLDCPLIDPRTKEEMTGKVYYVNDKYYYGLEDATTLASAEEIDNVVAIDKITINGKSEQINTTQNKNLLNDDNWYPLLEYGSIYSTKTNKMALISSDKYATIFVNLNPGTYTLSCSNSYPFAVNRLSKDGVATINVTPTNLPYTFTVTTKSLVGISVERNTSSTNSTDIAIGGNSVPSTFSFQLENGSSATSYAEFVPNSPSPEYPSTIDSIGVYNSATNKYDVTLFKGKANLMKNGYGELKNNTNFSSWTYVNNEVIDAKNSYKKTSSSRNTLLSNEFISVDTSKKYKLSLTVKDNGIGSIYYSGIIEYDIDKQTITAPNVMYVDNTLTYLTQDLKNGDSVIHLNSVANFEHIATTPPYRRGLIFWNYKDSTGYQYPELTYSRNVWLDLYDYNAINVVNNTITLRPESPWNHGTILAGTKVSQSNEGGTFNYALINYGTLTTNWRTYNASIQNTCTAYYVCTNKFRAGTKYIKLLVLNNFNNTANTVTYYKDISIREYDTPTVTYSLTEPLRSLPDGTTDKLIIDNVNKRAYVERNIESITYDGSSDESWVLYSNASEGMSFYITNNLKALGFQKSLCTNFKNLNYAWNMTNINKYSIYSDHDTVRNFYFRPPNSTITTVAAFKTWLSSNPANMIYKRTATRIEELPYQEVNSDKTNFNLTMEGAVQPTISIDYIKNG